MSFPGIIRRLFEHEGAGPLLREDILPPHADAHAPGGSDPIDFPDPGVSTEAFAELQQQVAALAESMGQGDPWKIFPLRVPIPVVGVSFGGSDGRRAIMPGETEAREDWILCDGGSDGKGGTVPDMRGRMIIGASDEHPVGSTGGSESHMHSISGTVDSAGDHTHEDTFSTSSSGSHSHTVSGSVGATTLTTNQMPKHYHSYTMVTSSSDFLTWGTKSEAFGSSDANTSPAGGSASHTHSLSSVSTGSDGSHTHAISGSVSSGGSHTHSLSITEGSTSAMPPYHSLAYIMRCA